MCHNWTVSEAELEFQRSAHFTYTVYLKLQHLDINLKLGLEKECKTSILIVGLC